MNSFTIESSTNTCAKTLNLILTPLLTVTLLPNSTQSFNLAPAYRTSTSFAKYTIRRVFYMQKMDGYNYLPSMCMVLHNMNKLVNRSIVFLIRYTADYHIFPIGVSQQNTMECRRDFHLARRPRKSAGRRHDGMSQIYHTSQYQS